MGSEVLSCSWKSCGDFAVTLAHTDSGVYRVQPAAEVAPAKQREKGIMNIASGSKNKKHVGAT